MFGDRVSGAYLLRFAWTFSQARRALEAGANLIIAAGGDGRSALAPRSSLAGRCRSPREGRLGEPDGERARPALAAEAALRVAFGGHERQIDLALADGLTFAAMAGIGLDAAAVGATSGGLKRVAAWTANAVVATAQVLRPRATFAIRLDGGEQLIRQAHSVTVGNSGNAAWRIPDRGGGTTRRRPA